MATIFFVGDLIPAGTCLVDEGGRQVVWDGWGFRYGHRHPQHNSKPIAAIDLDWPLFLDEEMA